ncbi:sulfur transferase domain-containing protein [Oxalobacteraceae bacterium R-40]|uniref:Sulfur transferase domain-containing protein n=1 Tax=Keguizhuia sedimenti TaxID=3064264 RepID=A0ABU1BVP9_9BURK|nr:sulfur transferase domain-containing protein [Oxalobacteraceae bacterium R-40]
MHKFKRLEDSMLLGPQPTEQDLQQAKEHGIKTVIDFRMPGETPDSNAEMAARHGFDYANIPVSKASLSADQIDELERIMDEKEGPFLIHCATGARAAMLLSLSKARKEGWDAERTFQEAKNLGYNLQESSEFASFIQSETSR